MSKPLRNGKKCQALDLNGRKCSRSATHREDYHGDAELYGSWNGRPQWVRVDLCEQHRITQKDTK